MSRPWAHPLGSSRRVGASKNGCWGSSIKQRLQAKGVGRGQTDGDTSGGNKDRPELGEQRESCQGQKEV